MREITGRTRGTGADTSILEGPRIQPWYWKDPGCAFLKQYSVNFARIVSRIAISLGVPHP